MPRNGGNHQVPLPNIMDSHVPYIPRGESNLSGTIVVPHVEIQTILPERNLAGALARVNIVREMASTAQSSHD